MLTGCAHSLALAGAASASVSETAVRTRRAAQPGEVRGDRGGRAAAKRRVSVRAFVPSVNVTRAVTLCVPALSLRDRDLGVARVPARVALTVRTFLPSTLNTTERRLRPETLAVRSSSRSRRGR